MANKRIIYGLKHAAQLADLSETTIQRYVRDQIIKPTRTTTGRCLFRERDIEKAVAYHRKQQATSS